MAKDKTPKPAPAPVKQSAPAKEKPKATNGGGSHHDPKENVKPVNSSAAATPANTPASSNGGGGGGRGLNWLRRWRQDINHPRAEISKDRLYVEIFKYLEGYLAGINAMKSIPNQPDYKLTTLDMIVVREGPPAVYRFEAYTDPPTVEGQHGNTTASDTNGPGRGGTHLIPAPPPTPPPSDDDLH